MGTKEGTKMGDGGGVGMATEMGTKIAQWGQLGKGHMQQGTKIGIINGHLNRLGNRIINGAATFGRNRKISILSVNQMRKMDGAAYITQVRL